jgi:hypothetical protein
MRQRALRVSISGNGDERARTNTTSRSGEQRARRAGLSLLLLGAASRIDTISYDGLRTADGSAWATKPARRRQSQARSLKACTVHRVARRLGTSPTRRLTG